MDLSIELVFKLGEYGRSGSSRVWALTVTAKTNQHANNCNIGVIFIVGLKDIFEATQRRGSPSPGSSCWVYNTHLYHLLVGRRTGELVLPGFEALFAKRGQYTLRTMNGPRILVGTSSFIASVWNGSFFPRDMKPSDYLGFYAERFPTVGIRLDLLRLPDIPNGREVGVLGSPGELCRRDTAGAALAEGACKPSKSSMRGKGE
jgi:hypothetical protein